jgi:hypothetical protein
MSRCCLHHNKVNHQWRRSGKVSGCGFSVRHEDHWKNAKNGGLSASTKQSKLHAEQPGEDSNLVRLGRACGGKCWKGHFEELVLCCGIGFDGLGTVSGLTETEDGKGMFSWDKKVVDCLEGSTKLGDAMRDRQLCMVACSLELGHDLMMSPKFNLSCVPGLEAAGLIPFEKDNWAMDCSASRWTCSSEDVVGSRVFGNSTDTPLFVAFTAVTTRSHPHSCDFDNILLTACSNDMQSHTSWGLIFTRCLIIQVCVES